MKKSIYLTTLGLMFVFYVIFFISLFFVQLQESDVDSERDVTFEKIIKKKHIKISSLTLFYHVHVLVFIGFGFLRTNLKKHGRSSLSFNFLLSGFLIIWHIIIDGLYYLKGNTIYMNIDSIIKAEIATIPFLIAFGMVLGKLNFLQLGLMVILETPIYAANNYFTEQVLMASDFGGIGVIHVFGAFFGLGIILVHKFKDGPREKTDWENSSPYSNITTMIGTLFIWLFLPSLNGIMIPPTHRGSAVFMTYTALLTSTIFVLLYLLCNAKKKEWKLQMMYIQNATLAAGVSVSATSSLCYGKLIIGLITGLFGAIFACIGYSYVQDSMLKIGLHDTCGAFSLHGLTGIIGGILGILNDYLLLREHEIRKETEYSYIIFPGMLSKDRGIFQQMSFQFTSLICSLIFGFLGGLITGALIILTIPSLTEEERFIDETQWLEIQPQPQET